MPPRPDEWSPDVQGRALQLVDGALDQTAAARAAWLREQCGNDAQLLDAATELLVACERASDAGFLEDSADVLGASVVKVVEREESALADATIPRVAAALEGRYTFVRELGRGGAASVHLARDHRHGRDVAIKVIRHALSDGQQRERFRKEIAIEAQLRHPYIIPLIDSGEANGIPYYVMPYVEGESLQQRLDRVGALPLDDALAVARDVAEALDYAHAHGVIHRDIKPRNILLTQGHSLVADFGIALALQLTSDTRITERGMAVGTPPYMSPEQVLSAERVDARSDVYALGCVVYEMLAGEVPYPGSTPQAIIAKHISAPIPDVSVLRPQVPAGVRDAVRAALAKHPADRFATAGTFVRALQDGATQQSPPSHDAMRTSAGTATPVARPSVTSGDGADRRLTRLTIAASLVLIVGAVALFGERLRARWLGPATTPDTTRYVVLPLARGDSTLRDVTTLVRDAAARWMGVTVLEAEPNASPSRPPVEVSARAAGRMAESLGAGRFLWGDVRRAGDSLRLHVRLSDVAGQGLILGERVVQLPTTSSIADSAVALAVDALLLRHVGDVPPSPGGGTRSLPAHQSFDAAWQHISTWQLDSAVLALERATAFDSRYALAHLWLAVARAWRGMEPARFRLSAEQANLRSADLGARERMMAQAILAEATGDLGNACPRWRSLAAMDSNDFAGWYGTARCERRDHRVVRDRRSPSGWRFRTSVQASLRAYQRAFRLHPAILSSLSDRGFEPLRRLLFGISILRAGYDEAPDSTFFVARISSADDSLTFTPYPSSTFALQLPHDATMARAMELQYEVQRDISASWVSSQPQSADARHALALSLAQLGDMTALDTLAVARRLAFRPGERFRTSLAAVWMPLAFGIARHDEDAVAQARLLADSLLATEDPAVTSDPMQMSAIAALLGRPGAAARFARRGEVGRELEAAPPLLGDGAALLVFAALGGPLDSVHTLAARVQGEIDHMPDARDRNVMALSFIVRAATLCFPTCRLSQAAALRERGNELLDMQLAFHEGDRAELRRLLDDLVALRRNVPPERITWDALAPEAALFHEMGDDRRVAEWLTPTLERLHRSSLHSLATPIGAASMVRTLQLRAMAADRLGDRTGAQRWSRMVEILRARGEARGR